MKTRKKNDELHWSDLMISAQKGNERDYKQLLDELGNAISAYLRTRFGDFDLLEDCVQESLMAVHKARDTFEASRLFRPWLFAIVNYKTIDVLRKRDQHCNIVKENIARQETLFLEDEQTVIKQLDMQKDCGHLLLALSDNHREAILLTKLQGLSMREAAKKLDISESAMKVRVHRALDASRQLLKAEQY